MNKIKRHLKNNLPIYLILLTCIIIVIIISTVTNTKEDSEKPTVDTSMLRVLTLDETLDRFEDDNPTFLVIGYKTCSATITYASYLKIAQAKYGYITYYLDLDTIDETQREQYDKLVEKLDMEYNFQGQTNTFGSFIGSTPMTIIIKDHKMVYGHIGTINDDSLGALTKMYGLATKDYQEEEN